MSYQTLIIDDLTLETTKLIDNLLVADTYEIFKNIYDKINLNLTKMKLLTINEDSIVIINKIENIVEQIKIKILSSNKFNIIAIDAITKFNQNMKEIKYLMKNFLPFDSLFISRYNHLISIINETKYYIYFAKFINEEIILQKINRMENIAYNIKILYLQQNEIKEIISKTTKLIKD